MDTNKVISSLCYFSIFFAGFILPIAVYFIVDDEEVKEHAKSAFLSHLIPLLTVPIFFILLFMFGPGDVLGFGIIGLIVLTGIINLVVLVWNIVRGIKVFS